MSVIEKLKLESLQLRKTRNSVAPAITFALSEIDKVGKNAGNRQTTEDEAIKVIQKLISVIDENIRLAAGNDGRLIALNFEKRILESVLPVMASDQEIISVLRDLFTGKKAEELPKKGDVMKALKQTFGSKVDMKRAGQLSIELYGV